jgi:hypothetical protein
MRGISYNKQGNNPISNTTLQQSGWELHNVVETLRKKSPPQALEEIPGYPRNIVQHTRSHTGMQCLYSGLGFSLGLGFGRGPASSQRK